MRVVVLQTVEYEQFKVGDILNMVDDLGLPILSGTVIKVDGYKVYVREIQKELEVTKNARWN